MATSVDEFEKERTNRTAIVGVVAVALMFIFGVVGCSVNETTVNAMANTKRIEACITAKGMPVRIVALDNRNNTTVIYACNLTNPYFP